MGASLMNKGVYRRAAEKQEKRKDIFPRNTLIPTFSLHREKSEGVSPQHPHPPFSLHREKE